MIFSGKRLGKRRAYTHQIGGEHRNLHLGMVLAVEDDRSFGFCETNNRTDLLQPGDVLGRSDGNQSQSATKDQNASFHISFLFGGRCGASPLSRPWKLSYLVR